MKSANSRSGEEGYILLALLLIVSLLMFSLAVAVPKLTFQIKRDREEELVHRGVQYSRAIRRYTKKTGRFPLKLEDLQEFGGTRFIRKLYKDPITGKDFKLVHMADIPGVGSSLNPGPSNPGGEQPNESNSVPDPAPGAAPDSSAAGNASPPPAQNKPATFGTQPDAGLSASNGLHDLGTGGVIFGVVSASKAATIREFNHKNHYNDWLFFYNPTFDRGGEIKGPTSLTPPTLSLQAPAPGMPQQNQPQGSPFLNSQPQNSQPPQQ